MLAKTRTITSGSNMRKNTNFKFHIDKNLVKTAFNSIFLDNIKFIARANRFNLYLYLNRKVGIGLH